MQCKIAAKLRRHGSKMLASQQSPSYYNHSPPAGFLADYSALPVLTATPTLSRRQTLQTRKSAPCFPNPKSIQLYLGRREIQPRPCLILRTHSGTELTKGEKKKVVFADDRGLELEEVRVMTEPSHVPPYWTLTILATNNINNFSPTAMRTPSRPYEVDLESETQTLDHWEACFKQPASDYIEFRRRITEENVTLENVIIKERESVLDGTVKVKNLDFYKEVFVRSTVDGWKTHEDTFCAFAECGPPNVNGISTALTSIYDTFAFKLLLPVKSRQLEFCIAFRCKGEEYWDSNGGLNYVIERKSARTFQKTTPTAYCGRVNSGNTWKSRKTGEEQAPYW